MFITSKRNKFKPGPSAFWSEFEEGRAPLLHGEDVVGPDFEELIEVVDRSDVLVIAFPFCQQRLLFDMRSDGLLGPLIEVVEPLGSPAERAAWLSERRPSLGAPEGSAFAFWPHSIGYLGASEVAEAVVRRVRREHGLDAAPELASVLRDLEVLERDCAVRAVSGGEGFQTLWRRAE